MTDHRPDLTDIIRATDAGVEIALKVQPKARRPGISGIHDQRLRVAVSAPPENGKANQAVLRLMATALEVSVRQVEIVRGTTSRSKQLRVTGVTLEDARSRLLS